LDGHLARFLPVSGIKAGLSAASLAHWEIYCQTKMFQNLDDRHASLGIQHIHHTGDEEGDFFAFRRFALG
jgi:hypothetical protein